MSTLPAVVSALVRHKPCHALERDPLTIRSRRFLDRRPAAALELA
ncbi:MAG TPA: hypothetical protein VKT99_11055 [Xanthobacteraceae bacterium]|jgi:hypothetical protein|nr:hypothetical protein [Xanthobacteraceae bacterium]